MVLDKFQVYKKSNFDATSSPAHLFAIRGRRKREFLKNCSGDEVDFDVIITTDQSSI